MADQAIWQTEGASKRSAVQGMFAEIAPTYDLLNSVMSCRMHHRWRRLAVQMLRLKPGDSALDVCCGTGDFLLPLRRAVGIEGKVAGLDFCLPMLEKISQKSSTAGEREHLTLGDACQLPIQSGMLQGVSVGWGIRNVQDIDRAHAELYRVLATGGYMASLDMAQPKPAAIRKVSHFLCNSIAPRLGALFGRTEAYTYLPKSTGTFRSREELAESMRAAGFTNVGYRDLMFGNICIHWGQKP